MGKKILLADDSITIQKVIELTFSDEDFEVVTVGNGRLAIEKVLDIRPDIVLCDIIMPEKDGYEVCDYVKKHPSLAHVPVLLLTGAFEPFDQERANRVGADGSLAKPFEPETLIAKVKELLKKAAVASWPPGRPAAPRPVEMPAVTAPVRPPEAARTQAFHTFATPPPRPVPVPPAPPAAPRPPAPSAPTPTLPTAHPVVAPASPTFDSGPQTFVAEPVLTPEPDVRFIPDEPFGVLESESFTEDALPSGRGAEPVSAPPEVSIDADIYAQEVEQITSDLIEVTPEESASLSSPPLSDDSASTVMFRADALPWTRPTGEVPLVERARAAGPSREVAEDPVLEEVFDEEAMTTLPSMASARPAAPATTQAPPVPAPAPRHERSIASPWETYQPPSAGEPTPVRLSEPPPRPPEPAPRTLEMVPPPPAVAPPPVAAPNPASFADLRAAVSEAVKPAVSSIAAEVAVPVDMVEKIAQRVVAQISEKVIQQIAWEVIPDLAEAMIKKEIERLKAELQQI